MVRLASVRAAVRLRTSRCRTLQHDVDPACATASRDAPSTLTPLVFAEVVQMDSGWPKSARGTGDGLMRAAGQNVVYGLLAAMFVVLLTCPKKWSTDSVNFSCGDKIANCNTLTQLLMFPLFPSSKASTFIPLK